MQGIIKVIKLVLMKRLFVPFAMLFKCTNFGYDVMVDCVFVWTGITCVCSWGRTYCQVICPARSSLMLCWARTLFRLSWETMTQRNTGQTISASFASPPIRHVSWRRGWWSCIAPTGDLQREQRLPGLSIN